MKNHYYLKRLDRIQHGLHLPTDDKPNCIFYTLFGVPDLDRAISRARKAGAASGVFVPANGSAVQFAKCGHPGHVTPGVVVVAFEAQEPGVTVAHRPLMLCSEAQLRQLATLDL